MGRPQKYVVRLTSDERKMLFELIAKGKASKEKLNRARILLKADCGEEGENWEDQKTADAFYVSILTVQRTRQSLVEEGLEDTLNRQPPKPLKDVLCTEKKKLILSLCLVANLQKDIVDGPYVY